MAEHLSRDELGYLEQQALRYAGGDLDPIEADAFEALLADDQHARDALVTAIGLLEGDGDPQAPSPDYRRVVRRRLGMASAETTRSARRARRIPAICSGLVGAAAAMAFLAVFDPCPGPVPAPGQAETHEVAGVGDISDVREAQHYAELSDSETLAKRVADFRAQRVSQKKEIKLHTPKLEELAPGLPPPGGSM